MKDITMFVVTIVLSFLVGGIGGAMLVAEKYAPEQTAISTVTPVVEEDDMHHAMDAMTSGLEGKTGDELDKAFLEEMIVHHEGAIEMAELVKNSEHRELRTLSGAIIKAQTKEIEQMKKWLGEWYK